MFRSVEYEAQVAGAVGRNMGATAEGKTAWESAAAGLIKESACFFHFDPDVEIDLIAKKVNSEHLKATKYDINGACERADVEIKSGDNLANSYRHFASEDADTTGATQVLHRAAAPERISEALCFSIRDPAAVDHLEIRLDVDLLKTSSTLLSLFPAHEQIENDTARDMIASHPSILDGTSKLILAQISLEGQSQPISIRIGGTATDSRRHLLECIMHDDAFKIDSVTCGHLSVSSAEGDVLEKLHKLLEQAVKDSYLDCLYCCMNGNYDEAQAIALNMADARHGDAQDVVRGTSNRCLFMALSACVQSVQALSVRADMSECLCVFTEATDVMAEALDAKMPCGRPGFNVSPEPAKKLTQGMRGVYGWMQGMIKLLQMHVIESCIHDDE
jgi:hypothetical protein